jgi:hypothetical protein
MTRRPVFWNPTRYGAMGCVGPHPGTPPAETDSHPAGARGTVMTRRFWAAAPSADAAKPTPGGVIPS